MVSNKEGKQRLSNRKITNNRDYNTKVTIIIAIYIHVNTIASRPLAGQSELLHNAGLGDQSPEAAHLDTSLGVTAR